MNEDLMTDKLKGSLIDNYVLTYYSDFVKENDVRIETTFEHAITYGLSIRSNASSNMLACFKRYVRNHPQEAFEIIAQNLEPLKVRCLILCLLFQSRKWVWVEADGWRFSPLWPSVSGLFEK